MGCVWVSLCHTLILSGLGWEQWAQGQVPGQVSIDRHGPEYLAA